MPYSRGDVILVEIAFSGVPGRKRRPAVVLSIDAFHAAGTKLVVAAITSNLSPPWRPGDVSLSDWSQAGLVKPSAVRGVLATVDRMDVIKRLGILSSVDLLAVEQSIGYLLGLSTAGASQPP